MKCVRYLMLNACRWTFKMRLDDARWSQFPSYRSCNVRFISDRYRLQKSSNSKDFNIKTVPERLVWMVWCYFFLCWFWKGSRSAYVKWMASLRCGEVLLLERRAKSMRCDVLCCVCIWDHCIISLNLIRNQFKYHNTHSFIHSFGVCLSWIFGCFEKSIFSLALSCLSLNINWFA